MFGEFFFDASLPDEPSLSETDKCSLIAQKYGQGYEELIELFKKAYPSKDLRNLLYLDSSFRKPTIDYIEMKAESSSAPVYSYMLAYEFPLDGRKPAWHSADIPFIFHNTEKVPASNELGVTDHLENQMCKSWISFAYCGDPNNTAIPHWSAYKKGSEATIIF